MSQRMSCVRMCVFCEREREREEGSERESDQDPFWLHKAQRHPLFRYESLLNDSQTHSSRTEVSETLGSAPWLSDGCVCEYIPHALLLHVCFTL